MEEEKKELQVENLEAATGGQKTAGIVSQMRIVCPQCGKFSATLTEYIGMIGNTPIHFNTTQCDNCGFYEQKPI